MTDPAAAAEPLRRWVQEHPALAERRPAAEIVRMALIEAEAARVRAIRSPIAGTYRFVLLFPRGDSLVFFARTAVHPTSMLDHVSKSEPAIWERRDPPRAAGYYVDAGVARSAARLPTRRAGRPPDGEGWRPQGYVAVVEATPPGDARQHRLAGERGPSRAGAAHRAHRRAPQASGGDVGTPSGDSSTAARSRSRRAAS
jgi:hypothetical protein